jgi:hypothetical protein
LTEWLARLTDKIEWSTFTGPFIATLALLFTIVSFWWLQARQGKLRSYPPHSLGYARFPSEVVIRLPLVLYNTGAKPIIIQDIRLSFTEKPGVTPLPWRTSRSQLHPANGDSPQLPAAFSVPGRTAQQHFIEFGIELNNPLPGIDLKNRQYQVLVEVLLGHKKQWEQLLMFPLGVKDIKKPNANIAYSNTALRPIS